MATQAVANEPKLVKITKGPKIIKRYVNPLIEFLLWLKDEVTKNKAKQGKNVKLTETPNGLKIDAFSDTEGGVSSDEFQWEPYPSVWMGEGDDPQASDRKMRFRLVRGRIGTGNTPAKAAINWNAEFVASGDPDDNDIEFEDAVVTQVWAKVPVSETNLGSDDLQMDDYNLLTGEGDDLSDIVTPDAPGEDGGLPASVIIPICEIMYYGGSLHFLPGVKTPLTLVLSGNFNCGNSFRTITALRAG